MIHLLGDFSFEVHNDMTILLGSRASLMNNQDSVNKYVSRRTRFSICNGMKNNFSSASLFKFHRSYHIRDNSWKFARGSRYVMAWTNNLSSASLLNFIGHMILGTTPENLHTTGQWIWHIYFYFGIQTMKIGSKLANILINLS